MNSGELKLRAARLKAVERWAYLAPAIWRMRLVAAKDCPTMGVSVGWVCYYSEAFVESLPLLQLASVLAHEAWHLLREHHDRAKLAGVDNDLKVLHWNIATDAEINDSLPDLPDGCITPETLHQEPGLLAEQYYAATELIIRPSSGQSQGSQQGPRNGGTPGHSPGAPSIPGGHPESSEPCQGGPENPETVFCGPLKGQPEQYFPVARITYGGSCADGRSRPWEGAQADKEHAPGAAEKSLIRRTVSEAVKQHGKMASDLERAWAGAEQEEKPLPWQQILAAEARRAVSFVSGQGDFTWTRPSRRSSCQAYLRPAIRRPKIDVAVIVDTSGSVSSEMLDEALHEVQACMQAAGGEVRVVSCDAEATVLGRTTNPKKLTFVGGGGTDMGVGIAAAEKLRPRPQIIVTITDGYTEWPDVPPAARHITVLTDESGSRPKWGRTVLLRRADAEGGGE